MRRLTIGALSLGLFLALSGCALLPGRHKPAGPAPADLHHPDLEMAVLYVGGQRMGQIPVTIQFTEAGDFPFAFVFDGVGQKNYLYRNTKGEAVLTIDMIAGEPAAIDESTGVWTALEFVSTEWLTPKIEPVGIEEYAPAGTEPRPGFEEPAWEPHSLPDPFSPQF